MTRIRKENNVKNYDILWLALVVHFARGGLYGGVQGFWVRDIHYYNYSDIVIFEIGEILMLGQKK